MKDEIKVWQTQDVKTKVCFYLMTRGIPFRYAEEDGLVFSAPEIFVRQMVEALVTSYGCKKPIINEYR